MLTFCCLGHTKVWYGNPGFLEERHGDMLVYGEISLLAYGHASGGEHLADLNYFDCKINLKTETIRLCSALLSCLIVRRIIFD